MRAGSGRNTKYTPFLPRYRVYCLNIRAKFLSFNAREYVDFSACLHYNSFDYDTYGAVYPKGGRTGENSLKSCETRAVCPRAGGFSPCSGGSLCIFRRGAQPLRPLVHAVALRGAVPARSLPLLFRRHHPGGARYVTTVYIDKFIFCFLSIMKNLCIIRQDDSASDMLSEGRHTRSADVIFRKQ